MSNDNTDAMLGALGREITESLCEAEHAKAKTVLDQCIAAATGDVARQRTDQQANAVPAGVKWMQLASYVKKAFDADTVSALLAEAIIRFAEQKADAR
ncbi:hypothetical protein [Mycobacteroides abscessus]|uniref:hypothetical protein n=1 Tax=Mycobacteroides abscessus TaxID=36809 RepID=UPI0009276007|nr:hypothetical protein [Mycobacteroides abscessus]SKS27838.1 Uncharacterised protein [Mycobacteroides abscessus subsp. abscessus]SHU54998.1 Uncharacterised protein [Mycobacteroides abscessus subsp. bolletii]SHW63577.1 Uncharacterised protein [Mycobacteroides abscessus subsp. bolletii]SHW91634.1 Uncharacterised protein [Mycobacteroides abscessus subsp. bolletii]SHX33452.1 Uncharacterised protein [Mycobacteroides abscessus subsp. bolletii]